tara:strand:+ start:313 stop:606 length:294 start_codon:yes stop_codon:yes gene_type:complete
MLTPSRISSEVITSSREVIHPSNIRIAIWRTYSYGLPQESSHVQVIFGYEVRKVTGTQRSNIVGSETRIKFKFIDLCDHRFWLFMMRSKATRGQQDA